MSYTISILRANLLENTNEPSDKFIQRSFTHLKPQNFSFNSLKECKTYIKNNLLNEFQDIKTQIKHTLISILNNEFNHPSDEDLDNFLYSDIDDLSDITTLASNTISFKNIPIYVSIIHNQGEYDEGEISFEDIDDYIQTSKYFIQVFNLIETNLSSQLPQIEIDIDNIQDRC